MEIEGFETTLEREVREVPGAQHLLVTFPGLSTGAAPPRIEEDRRVADFRAHRLYLGSGPDLLMSPTTNMAGAQQALRLIPAVAADLGVELRNVICWGHSYSALCSLFFGLRLGVGHIVVGAPQVRMGTWVSRLAKSNPKDPEQRALRMRLFELINDGDPETRDFLDTLIVKTARESRHSCSIQLFTSPGDSAHKEVVWFYEQLMPCLNVTARIHESDYPGHEAMKLPYYQFLVHQLRRVIGVPLLPPAAKSAPVSNTGSETGLNWRHCDGQPAGV